MRSYVETAWKSKLALPAFNVFYLPVMAPLAAVLRDSNAAGIIQVCLLELVRFDVRSLAAVREEYEKVKNAHAWLQIKADAVGTWVKRETVFEPDNERHEIYSERIGKYRDLFPLMKEYLAGLEGGE